MISFRRDALEAVNMQADTHAGLWLDKYLKDDSEDGKKNLVKEVTGIHLPNSYTGFFERWQNALAERGAKCREARTLGRLAINLGAEAVLETSIALHHTYGVPYIPGSALKGLAAHYVINYPTQSEWSRDSEAFDTLFGNTTSAGYVTFHDALYVPTNNNALRPDIITVHHPKYYQGEKDAPPADWDSPTPIPFITATGTFLIALSGPAKWVKATFEILELALEREGIGAKTSSGYGRMMFIDKENGTESVVSKQKGALQELPPGYQRGVVKNFMETKGYGFIQPETTGKKDIFVHVNNLAAGLKELKPRQRVIFKTGPGKKPGEEQALDVRLDE